MCRVARPRRCGSLELLVLAAGARLDAFGHRPVDVVIGDPALVVILAHTSGDTNRLGGRYRFNDIDGLLGLLIDRRTSALSLGEEGLYPGLVDEVESTSECDSEEEVEEDTKLGGKRLVYGRG